MHALMDILRKVAMRYTANGNIGISPHHAEAKQKGKKKRHQDVEWFCRTSVVVLLGVGERLLYENCDMVNFEHSQAFTRTLPLPCSCTSKINTSAFFTNKGRILA